MWRTCFLGIGTVSNNSKPSNARLIFNNLRTLLFADHCEESLKLSGKEVYDNEGLEQGLKPRQEVTVKGTREDGSTFSFQTIARLDSPIDVTYYENGGILLTVLRKLLKA